MRIGASRSRSKLLALAWAMVIGGASLLFLAQPAFGASFQVSPTRFEFSLAKRFTNFFTVTNNSDQTLRVRIYPRFIELSADNKLIEKVGHPHDLSRWMVFNPRLVTVRPRRKRTVRFSVRPPGRLDEGEYRAVVFFEELPGKVDSTFRKKTEKAVALQLKFLTRLGVTLYGTVGEPRAKIEVVGEPKIEDKERLLVSTILENTGNARLQIQMNVALIDEDGEKIHESNTRLLLQRAQKTRWQFKMERPKPGSYRLVANGTSKGKEVLEFTVPIELGSE